MVTVTAKPITVDGTIETESSFDFSLCGFGSQIPRATGTADSVGTFVETDLLNVKGAAPEITVSLIGNDLIQPPGTYYTVTTRNSNGDVLQINAYIFLDGHTYNLDYATPYNPNQPPPPLPPLIYNQLLLVAFSPTPDFPGDTYTAWRFYLTGDTTGGTITGCVPGNLYTFIITQDNTGGHSFVWPDGVTSGAIINKDAHISTIQTFLAVEDGTLYAVSAGTYTPEL